VTLPPSLFPRHGLHHEHLPAVPVGIGDPDLVLQRVAAVRVALLPGREPRGLDTPLRLLYGLRGRDLDTEVIERAQARGGRGVEGEVERGLGDVELRVPGLQLHRLEAKEGAIKSYRLLEVRRVQGDVGLQYLAHRSCSYGRGCALEGGEGNEPAARAAFGVQEPQQVAQPAGRRAVAQEPAFAALRDQAGRLEGVEVVRQRRGGDAELLLDLPGDEPVGMGSEHEAHDAHPGLVPQGGEHGGVADGGRGGRNHISILLEATELRKRRGAACAGYGAGATSPAARTLRSSVCPSITWSSPTSESRTVPRTTRTFRPRMLFAIVLSVTKLPASIDTLGPIVASWIVTPSSM